MSSSVISGGRIWLAAIFVGALLCPQPGLGIDTQIAGEQPKPDLRVTGTLMKLDMSSGKGMLMTDLEKPVFFRLDRPELFERISIGDRVTVQLDEDGRLLKVIETLPAEIHEPLPPPK